MFSAKLFFYLSFSGTQFFTKLFSIWTHSVLLGRSFFLDLFFTISFMPFFTNLLYSSSYINPFFLFSFFICYLQLNYLQIKTSQFVKFVQFFILLFRIFLILFFNFTPLPKCISFRYIFLFNCFYYSFFYFSFSLNLLDELNDAISILFGLFIYIAFYFYALFSRLIGFFYHYFFSAVSNAKVK